MKKQEAKYVDGFVLVIPKKNVDAYKKMARGAKKIWMKHGALNYKECIGDDLRPKTGGHLILPFGKLTKVKPSETVWFSYIEYKSKAHRDQVNKKVMAEMEKMAEMYKDMPMPFDMKKMSYGGFKVAV